MHQASLFLLRTTYCSAYCILNDRCNYTLSMLIYPSCVYMLLPSTHGDIKTNCPVQKKHTAKKWKNVARCCIVYHKNKSVNHNQSRVQMCGNRLNVINCFQHYSQPEQWLCIFEWVIALDQYCTGKSNFKQTKHEKLMFFMQFRASHEIPNCFRASYEIAN